MFRKFLEYAIMFSGVAYLQGKEPIWCLLTLVFVFIDAWDWITGYIEFKQHVRSTEIKIPKGTSKEEIDRILNEEIGKLIRGDNEWKTLSKMELHASQIRAVSSPRRKAPYNLRNRYGKDRQLLSMS